MKRIIENFLKMLEQLVKLNPALLANKERQDFFVKKVYPNIKVLNKLKENLLTVQELNILISQLSLMQRTKDHAIQVFELLGLSESQKIDLQERMKILEGVLDKLENILVLIEIEEYTGAFINDNES